MTLVRFLSPLRDAHAFTSALSKARSADFGLTMVERLDLVFGDRYHTEARERTIAGYPLRKLDRRGDVEG